MDFGSDSPRKVTQGTEALLVPAPQGMEAPQAIEPPRVIGKSVGTPAAIPTSTPVYTATRSSRARHGAPQGSNGDRLGSRCARTDHEDSN